MLTRHEHTELSQLEFNICVIHLKSNGHVRYIRRGTNQILHPPQHTHMRERTHTNGFCPIYMTVFVVVDVYVEQLYGLKLFTF